MAAKRFAAQTLAGSIWTQVMEGQIGYDSTITIHVTNHNEADVKVSMAITADVSANIPNEDIFYLDQTIFGRNSREFPGIVIEEGYKLAAQSNSAGVTILVYGFEEEI